MKTVSMIACLMAVATIITGCKSDAETAKGAEKAAQLAAIKFITFSNGAEIPVEYEEGSITAKKTPNFMILKDILGQDVVYLVDTEYVKVKYGGLNDEASQRYRKDKEEMVKKNLFGFQLVMDKYFKENGSFKDEYLAFIEKCRLAVERETEGNPKATKYFKNFVARRIADKILQKNKGEIPDVLIKPTLPVEYRKGASVTETFSPKPPIK